MKNKVGDSKKYKKLLLKIVNVFVLTILSVFIGFILMVSTYGLFQHDYSEENFYETSVVLIGETDYQKMNKYHNSMLDNFTDSIMLLTAYHPIESGDSIIKSAMRNSYVQNGTSPRETFENRTTKATERNYPRYWHGYLVVLKPLLKLFSYRDIRIINAMAQGGLLIVLFFLMFKRKYHFLIIPFLGAYIFMSPFTITYSLQYSSVWYITLISSILYLLFQDKLVKDDLHYVLFAIIGICTSFFDFLTYPIITLGFLLIIMISTEKISFWDAIKRIFLCGISWSIGYTLMWIGKIILATLILNDNTILKEAQSSFFRWNSWHSSAGKLFTTDMFYKRLNPFISSLTIENTCFWVPIFGLISVAWTLIKYQFSSITTFLTKVGYYTSEKDALDDLLLFKKITSKKLKVAVNVVLRLCVICGLSLITFGWFILVRRHTYSHAFMTYRTFSVALFALFTILFKLSFDLDRILHKFE